MAIHRITEEMVADKPWIEEVLPHYIGSRWYVAHNASFDRRVLPEMHGEWICTMKMARRLWPGIKYSNMGLYKSRKLSVATPAGLHQHRALYDCYITGKAVAEIAENDPGYLRWLFNNLDRMSPELRLTLKHYLGE